MMLRERSRPLGVVSVVTATVAAIWIYVGLRNKGSKRTAEETVNAPCISAFQLFLEDSVERDASDRALRLIQEAYSEEYYNSSISHHHFVRTAPSAIRDVLSEFVWTNSTLKEVRAKFETSGSIKLIPDVFDEIYLMRPEFDLVDLKKVHYDGNLKVPGICTIRALTYLSGKDATLYALTSQGNFTTSSHTAVVLDFDRELHYASLNHLSIGMEDRPNPEPRVMVKSALHVVLPETHPGMTYFRIVLHRMMVFAARSFRRAFESKSQSGSNAPSKSNLVSMMVVDNLMRSLNKIHMSLPLIIIGLPLGAVFLAPVLYPVHFFPYIAFIVARFVFLMITTAQSNFFLSFLVASASSIAFLLRSRVSCTLRLTKISKTPFKRTIADTPTEHIRWNNFSLVPFHIAWISICLYAEANSAMACNFLLAPWQQAINLDDII